MLHTQMSLVKAQLLDKVPAETIGHNITDLFNEAVSREFELLIDGQLKTKLFF